MENFPHALFLKIFVNNISTISFGCTKSIISDGHICSVSMYRFAHL